MNIFRFILMVSLLLISGCYDDKKSYIDPYAKKSHSAHVTATSKKDKKINALEAKIKLASLETQHKEHLASIQAKKETKIKQLELEKIRLQNKTKLTLSDQESKNKILLQEKISKYQSSISRDKNKLYQEYLIVAGALLFVLIMSYLIINSRNQKLKAKIQETDLKHREHMQESKQHHERINKTLEIIADEKTDKNLKKELVRLLKNQNTDKTKLLS